MPWNINLPEAEWYTPDDPDLPLLVETIEQDVPILAIDTETTGLNVVNDVPLFWSLSWGERRICMPASTLQTFAPVLQDPKKRWVLANAKYDQHILANVGLALAGELIDCQVMHALLYEEQPHGLKYMAENVLGWAWSDFEDTFRFNKAGKLTAASGAAEVRRGGAFQTVQDALLWCYHNDLPRLIEYAANDAYGTWKCYVELKKQLEASNTHSLYPETYCTLADYFFKIEVPFTRVLWTCERHGALIDNNYLQSIEGSVEKALAQLRRRFAALVGRPVNMNSTPDLRKVFFTERGLKSVKRTKGGKSGVQQASLDAQVLEELAEVDEAAQVLLEYRELEKLMGTYVIGLAQHRDEKGRIHSRLNQTGARTGRISSADPNCQNIPNPENDKFKIRKAFIPEEGYTLIVADYDTLEMRLLACASMEPSMIEMIKSGRDIHMGNATLVFGKMDGFDYDEIAAAKKMQKKFTNGEVGEEAITERMHHLLQRRMQVKTIGFGLIYGMKENALARRLKCTKEEAIKLTEKFMGTYPAVKSFFDETVKETRSCGYSFTVLGRRRFLPDIVSKNEMDRWGAERQATNQPIQGSAADVVKMAMIRCYYEGDLEKRYGCRMLLQVHDELMFECPTENAEEVKPIIKEMMEHSLPTDLATPLTISMGVGKSWAETH